ncbi:MULTISPECIES: efflux RND transporter permease subunit [unclassified Wenzhouxiangella]|uniref:efflux RND transporter permease subunit n=1 Tax=unclassified Wenzhouxiangella TaxID=2613841 RepID=UPI000E32C487|nr:MULTISPECIES: efflux RND transporter permease subunit [unclassified Wenzhouxiangella]RFF28022.1 efflux RND transporter permease subunit [Wenzhouxiangella sp. 15181]RFP68608.1 efflux RND transporter permease subunit [Wenzhouxiangella sp. 15190]
MIGAIIRWSIRNRFLVLMLSALLAAWGTIAMLKTPLDAIPDLSDVQVIVKTTYPGQAPQVVEDQVTYPLTTAMLSVPGATTVRGYSFFNDSFVYVIFEDGTDLYWARSRVLEYLSQVAPTLPQEARPALGPDATGVGWVYQYALIDRTGQHDLAELRSIQDWFLKYELQTVEGVSEVASIGGMVRQYQVVVDPDKLRAHDIPLTRVREAIQSGNMETGGRVIEMAEAEYMVRATGYVDSLEDIEAIPVRTTDDGVPIRIGDIAKVQFGPELRRGVGELNGEGEAVGGVIVMRFGENAMATIERVKEKLETLKEGLPEGVEVVETYDRSSLINRAVDTLREKLIEEFIVVALVCLIFLFHFRSSLVIVLSLPLGILSAFIIMQIQGINANIMSLGGIAIAIGAMVDAAIVMIENYHKHLEHAEGKLEGEARWNALADAAVEVGPALFFSLLIIALSFVPIFALEAQEGRMFKPLAFTKTYAMAAAAGLAITLVPVLMGYLIRGHITPEHKNPINRFLTWVYRPILAAALRFPISTVALTLIILASAWIPYSRIGSEFMPELNEGDLLYMPSAYPAASAGKMAEILGQTNRLIMTVPEVETAYAKAGRADTATDPAPLTMIETTIRLKPRSEWRDGMTMDKLKAELDELVQVPSLTNTWIMPIKNRIDMLATGIKTPVGVKVSGADLEVINQIGEDIEDVIEEVPGTASVYADRVTGGRYVTVDVQREEAARFGLNIRDVHEIVRSAVGGMSVGESVDGLERYPINLRYPRHVRDSLEDLDNLTIVTPKGAQIPLSAVANIAVETGPGVIRTENARLNGWIYIDVNDKDLGGYVQRAKRAVAEQVELPAGYSLGWSGQYEFMQRAADKLKLVVPAAIGIIVLLLFMNFRNPISVLIILGTLPLSLVGSYWLLYLLGYNQSVAVGAGMIALAGVAVEIGVLMLVYLDQALARHRSEAAEAGHALSRTDVMQAVTDGALLRVRPIMMTVSVIIAGLLPIMLGHGTGSEIMRRIAAPMVGGMISVTILTLLVVPTIYYLWKSFGLKSTGNREARS